MDDLMQRAQINRVVINGHPMTLLSTSFYLSSDNRNWTRVQTEDSGNGGAGEIAFTVCDARYARLLCKKNSYVGYSDHDLEVDASRTLPLCSENAFLISLFQPGKGYAIRLFSSEIGFDIAYRIGVVNVCHDGRSCYEKGSDCGRQYRRRPTA